MACLFLLKNKLKIHLKPSLTLSAKTGDIILSRSRSRAVVFIPMPAAKTESRRAALLRVIRRVSDRVGQRDTRRPRAGKFGRNHAAAFRRGPWVLRESAHNPGISIDYRLGRGQQRLALLTRASPNATKQTRSQY